MDEAEFTRKLDIAFFIVAIGLIFVAIVFFTGFYMPGVILIIVGIAAIVVGSLKVISGIYYGFLKKN